MSDYQSTVIIPIIELKHESNPSAEMGHLLGIRAEDESSSKSDEIALIKEWELIAAPLPSAFRNDGSHAVATLRKLPMKLPCLDICQRLKKYAWLENQRLYANGDSIDNREGGSAQLGMAIALLLNGSTSPIRYAIATGKLSDEKHADNDVAIEAVSSVPEKFDLLIAKRNALPAGKLYCFTPTHYKKDQQLYAVAELPQLKTLAALDIEVKPINWLSEAADTLQATKSRDLPQDKRWTWAISLFVAVCLTLGLYWQWLNLPIPLEILAGKQQASPFLICTNRDQSEVRYYDLQRDGGIPLLPLFNKENGDYNIGLAWKLRAKQTLFSQRYYVAYIHFGEKTGYKLINKAVDSNSEQTITADQILEQYWTMLEENSKQQENLLFIAVQRTPIAADKLNQAFAQRFPETKPLNVLQARDFLTAQFPNNYSFAYKSIFSDLPCLKPSS